MIRSEQNGRPYTGITWNVAQRLATHNSGGSIHRASHRPWRLAASVEFQTEAAALEFESYLKSRSGRACERHFR